jgi:hypothetical protein
MSLENVKVGDWIKVQVTEVKDSENYPIRCGERLSFRKNGIYHYAEEQVAFPLEETERWMLVSNDSINWVKRKVITQKNGKFLAWIFAENDEELNSVSDAASWDFAKEIDTKIEFNLELSLEEIAEKFGVNVEQIKIKK